MERLRCMFGRHRMEVAEEITDALGRRVTRYACAVCGEPGRREIGPLPQSAVTAYRVPAPAPYPVAKPNPVVAPKPPHPAWRPVPRVSEERRREVLHMLTQMRSDEVARVVMEEGVGRAEPLTPRTWSVQGMGRMCTNEEAR